jgi:hypothetical protein
VDPGAVTRQITRSPEHQPWADTWNLALRQIAAERVDVATWDWPAVMAADVPGEAGLRFDPRTGVGL